MNTTRTYRNFINFVGEIWLDVDSLEGEEKNQNKEEINEEK